MGVDDVIQYDPALDLDPHAGEVDVSLIDMMLDLTPTQRIIRLERTLESVQALRKAGIQSYGFDPRIPE